MKELRQAINEHIVSEKMKDILLLMLNRIEDNSDSIDQLYQSEVRRHEIHELKQKLADLLKMPLADLD